MSTPAPSRIDTEPSAERKPRTTGIGAAMWLGSAATHASALAVMALIYWSVAAEPTIEAPPFTGSQVPIPPKPPITPNESTKPNDAIPLPETSEVSQVETPIDVIVDIPGDEDATADLSPMPKGDLSAVSDVATADNGLSMAIGAGMGDIGAHGGPYSRRGKHGSSGPRGTLIACGPPVDRALRWFKRHQSVDGRWDADGYFRNCSEDGVKCEPGKDQSGDTDVAMTGYAVLCFLGDGYDASTPSKYRPVVRRGIDWLLANQKPDGLLGERNYEHAIATMALAQAYAMAPDPRLREPTQRAVDIILARQNRDAAGSEPYNRLGWDYVTPTGRNDASVTGWNVMALKSAMTAGLRVGDGLAGCKNWLERSWTAANTAKPWCASTRNLDPYRSISRFGYVWKADSNEVEISGWDAAGQRPANIDSQDLAPVGLMSAVFLGHRSGDPMLESLANYIAAFHQPTAWPCNTYYLYYNTLSMYQVGGKRWDAWAKNVLPMINQAQRREDGCQDGSWDWQGTKFPGHDTGRVLSTAYACMSMQVYWIYERNQAPPEKR